MDPKDKDKTAFRGIGANCNLMHLSLGKQMDQLCFKNL